MDGETGQPGLPGMETGSSQDGKGSRENRRALIHEGMVGYMTLPQVLSEAVGITKTRADGMLGKHRLRDLARMSSWELARAGRLTDAQACRLTAALNLARRLNESLEEAQSGARDFNSPEDVAAFFRPIMEDLGQEELHGLYLNNRNGLEVHRMLYRGNVNSSVIRPAEVLKTAVTCNTPNMIIAHNHPSGDPTPSPADVSITRELVQAGKLLGIDLLDHMVIAPGNRHVSLKEKGLMD